MSSVVSIIDATGTDLSVSTSVSPSLSNSDWSILNSTIPANGSPVNTLQFNRFEGITHNKTWIFTTTFVFDGVDISLQEELTGTLSSSDLKLCMTAGPNTTGFSGSSDPTTITFTGTSGTTDSLTWSFPSKTGVYDNVQYSLAIMKPAYKKITPVMPQIKNVIYLMLENRSLDNVLGWLYNNTNPSVVYPAGSSECFDGIPQTSQNSYKSTIYKPTNGTEFIRRNHVGFHSLIHMKLWTMFKFNFMLMKMVQCPLVIFGIIRLKCPDSLMTFTHAMIIRRKLWVHIMKINCQ